MTSSRINWLNWVVVTVGTETHYGNNNTFNSSAVSHLHLSLPFICNWTNSLFTFRSPWFQGNISRQRPMWSVQVHAAQSCSDRESDRNKGVLLQGHSVRTRSSCSRKQVLSVAEEERTGTLPATSVHEESRTLPPGTVSWEHCIQKLPCCLSVIL